VHLDRERMRSIRRNRGLSQEALGRRLGTTQGRIAVIEGGASITQETAERVASALLCSVSDLVQPEEPTLTFKVSELSPEILRLLTRK
jgi:transcriptional regulator with XRE-family HTH domain